jgi:hypothetical protein
MCRHAVGLPHEVVMPMTRVVSGADLPAAAVLDAFKPVTTAESQAGYATWVLEPMIRSVRTDEADLLIDFTAPTARERSATSSLEPRFSFPPSNVSSPLSREASCALQALRGFDNLERDCNVIRRT